VYIHTAAGDKNELLKSDDLRRVVENGRFIKVRFFAAAVVCETQKIKLGDRNGFGCHAPRRAGLPDFSFAQTYQNGKSTPNDHKLYQRPPYYTKGSKMAKNTNIFHYKALQNIRKLGFLVLK
jgi:hypothetical protein